MPLSKKCKADDNQILANWSYDMTNISSNGMTNIPSYN